MSSTNTEAALNQMAAEPIRKASGDAGSMETHSIADMIALDKYCRSREAATAAATPGNRTTPFLAQKLRFGDTLG